MIRKLPTKTNTIKAQELEIMHVEIAFENCRRGVLETAQGAHIPRLRKREDREKRNQGPGEGSSAVLMHFVL